MSDQAETYIRQAMADKNMPDPCHRREVLTILARCHVAGPLRIETSTVARLAGLSTYTLWQVMIDLHKKRYFRVCNIGGLMTVTFPFDFPPDHPAYVSVSPDSTREALT